MKHTPTKSIQPSALFFTFLLVILIGVSCTDSPTKDAVVLDDTVKIKTVAAPSLVTDCKNVFLTMRTSVPDFLRVHANGGFKRIICQFRNNGFNATSGAFVYDVIPYALKNSEYFDSTFMQVAKGINLLNTPFRLANIELRNSDIQKFKNDLAANGTPIGGFDSIMFKPFIDNSYGSNIVNLQVIPFKNTPLLDSAAVAATTTKFNPCPPARQQ